MNASRCMSGFGYSNDDGLSGVPLVDAHCHLQLSPIYERADSVIESAKERASVVFANVCGVAPGEDWRRIEQLALAHPSFIIPGFGLHPWWIQRYFEARPIESVDVCTVTNEFDAYASLEGELREILTKYTNAYVGECGLDKNIKGIVSMNVQEAVLTRHLSVAHDMKRTVLLHCVGAWGRLYQQLKEANTTFPEIPAVVLHSANNLNPELVAAFLQLPHVYFSFTAIGALPLLDERHEIRRQKMISLVKRIPHNRLLLETDSPDQIPRALLTAPSAELASSTHVPALSCNEPTVIRFTCYDIANILGMPPSDLAALTTDNAKRAWSLD